jgi:hypothetical protein
MMAENWRSSVIHSATGLQPVIPRLQAVKRLAVRKSDARGKIYFELAGGARSFTLMSIAALPLLDFEFISSPHCAARTAGAGFSGLPTLAVKLLANLGFSSEVNLMKKDANGEEKCFVILTEFKEIFCGYSTDVSGDRIKLRNARQAIYYSAESKGLLGLAVNGPGSGSKIGPAANIEVRRVVNVIECSSAAAQVWEKAKWSN